MHNVSIHRCSAYLGAYSFLSVQNQTHFIVDYEQALPLKSDFQKSDTMHSLGLRNKKKLSGRAYL